MIREGDSVDFSLLGGIVLAMGAGMRIVDNVIEDNGRGAEPGGAPLSGILVVIAEAGTVISRNRVRNNVSLRPDEQQAKRRGAGGIVVIRTSATPESPRAALVIHENEVVTWEGMDVPAGPALSVSAEGRAPFGAVCVTDNHFASS